MTDPIVLHWTSASRTDVGLVRERNEDAVLDAPERGLWAVADGMGGHAVGDYASRTVVELLDSLTPPQTLEQGIAAAHQRLQIANQQIQAEAASRHLQRIGSTVAVLLSSGERAACLWAGDSRVYLCREGHLMQITRDHSQAEEMRARGWVSNEDDIPLGARNVITRAVGAAPLLEVDDETVEVRDGDVFLLCSDGLSNLLSDEEMAAALGARRCREAVESLVELALSRGGRDNISAVVARAEDLYNSDKTMLNPDL